MAADVIYKLKVMPENPEVDLEAVKAKSKELIEAFDGMVHKQDIEPVAFGLNSLMIIFLIDEQKGRDIDPLEADIKAIEGVNSVEVVDVRRAFG